MRCCFLLALLGVCGAQEPDRQKELAKRVEALEAQLAQQTIRAAQAEALAERLRKMLERALQANRDLQKHAEALVSESKKLREINDHLSAERQRRERQSRPRKTQERRLQDDVMRELVQAIERYLKHFRRLPPLSVPEINAIKVWKSLRLPNATNVSSEILRVALRHPDLSLPLHRVLVGNTDDDRFHALPHGQRRPDALEILDAWGHPMVYVHKNAYGSPQRVVNGNGETVEVRAVVKPDGTYYNPTTYQLISLGRNGRQDRPGAKGFDDVTNFAR